GRRGAARAFRDRLACAFSRAETGRLEGNAYDRIDLENAGEFVRRNFRSFGYSDLIEHELGRSVVRARLPEQLNQVFRVAQAGQIRCGRHDDLVGGNQTPFGPIGPNMRHVQYDERNGRLRHVEQTLEGVVGHCVREIQGCRRGQHVEMFAALGDEALKKNVVDSVVALDGLFDALRRFEVECQACTAEWQVEVGENDLRREKTPQAGGHVVSDN